MAPLRNLKSCRKLKGADFFFVGSVGGKSNWFARPIPIRVSKACRKSFFSALVEVRREFDLLHPDCERPPSPFPRMRKAPPEHYPLRYSKS